MQEKNLLITGGCGFVGRHFCKRFFDIGWKVHCVDNLMSESSKHPDFWPKHLKCDVVFINDDCRNYFKNNSLNFDLIIHLAAVVGGRNTIENNPIEVGEDLSIDSELFKYVVKNKPKKLVYFSSSAAYPVKYQSNMNFTKLSEEMISFDGDIGLPDLTYGWAKLSGEYLAQLAHKKYGLDVVCYRPFSGYGEDQNDVYPFMGILNRVINKENPVNIWSNTTRDFIYIEDVIDCVLLTMNKINDGTSINIGTGVETTFEKLAELMCEICDHNAKINIHNDKPKGVCYRVSNTNKMNEMGYYHKISLRDGIKKCLKLK